ncbi:MAG TPA: FtsQ-type POTRA domain-containing protein [Candidatus Nanopelagicales bacterium]|nr:FtsQ-type POTRA domain-containing protein [Candidatus Nanopelagicales bacterium]
MALLALAGGAVWLVGFSSVLATQRVGLSGLKTLDRSEVTDTAAVPLGLPLARQDLAGIADRVATLPQVEHVAVRRTWPATVAITVTERTPVFAVRYANLYVLVDKHGIPYLTVTKQPDLPLAAASRDDRASLTEIATVSRELPKKLRDQVVTIRAESPYALVLVLDSGVEISWGTSEQSKLKGEIALALLRHDPKAIDVSAPHNPTIR